jgi:hypothetical protein
MAISAMVSVLTSVPLLSAPMNEAVEYVGYNFNDFFGHQSIYRGPPTPQLEAELDRLRLCMSREIALRSAICF